MKPTTLNALFFLLGISTALAVVLGVFAFWYADGWQLVKVVTIYPTMG